MMCRNSSLSYLQQVNIDLGNVRYVEGYSNRDRLGDVVVERPPRVREVAGSIPGRVISKTLKMPSLALRIVG